MKRQKLVIFDLDGTLVHPFTTIFLPGVRLGLRRYKKRHPSVKFAIATNKGNIGLKHWRQVVRDEGGDIGDPNANGWTTESTIELINTVALEIDAKPYWSFRYQSKKGNWSPVPVGEENAPLWSESWRKPNPGMLLQAMADHGVTPAETLMVGDSEDDRLAAEKAGVEFVSAEDFFRDSQPRIVVSYYPPRAWEWLSLRDEVDQDATTANYEAMLRKSAEIYGHSVEIRKRKTPGVENVRIINAESKEHAQRIFDDVSSRILDAWINRNWVKFTSVSAHIDALIDGGHADMLVVAPVYIRDMYPADEVNAAAESFAAAEAFKEKFCFYLG